MRILGLRVRNNVLSANIKNKHRQKPFMQKIHFLWHMHNIEMRSILSWKFIVDLFFSVMSLDLSICGVLKLRNVGTLGILTV